jgi:hypothetical protein
MAISHLTVCPFENGFCKNFSVMNRRPSMSRVPSSSTTTAPPREQLPSLSRKPSLRDTAAASSKDTVPLQRAAPATPLAKEGVAVLGSSELEAAILKLQEDHARRKEAFDQVLCHGERKAQRERGAGGRAWGGGEERERERKRCIRHYNIERAWITTDIYAFQWFDVCLLQTSLMGTFIRVECPRIASR